MGLRNIYKKNNKNKFLSISAANTFWKHTKHTYTDLLHIALCTNIYSMLLIYNLSFWFFSTMFLHGGPASHLYFWLK